MLARCRPLSLTLVNNSCRRRHAEAAAAPSTSTMSALRERLTSELRQSNSAYRLLYGDEASLLANRRQHYTVAIEGNIGCGKSTMLDYFSSHPLIEILAEPIEEWRHYKGMNIFEKMYENPAEYAFPFQQLVISMMRRLHCKPASKPIRVMERSALSSRYVFSEELARPGYIKPNELAILDEELGELTRSREYGIDLVVYILSTPSLAYERMRTRGRAEEMNVALSYIEDIDQLYNEWLLGEKFPIPSPVLVVDGDLSLTESISVYEKIERLLIFGLDSGERLPISAVVATPGSGDG